MSRPQFKRRASRPMTPAAYRRAVRQIKRLAYLVELYAPESPDDTGHQRQLTRSINSLALVSSSLSERHRRAVDPAYDRYRSQPPQWTADDYDAAQNIQE